MLEAVVALPVDEHAAKEMTANTNNAHILIRIATSSNQYFVTTVPLYIQSQYTNNPNSNGTGLLYACLDILAENDLDLVNSVSKCGNNIAFNGLTVYGHALYAAANVVRVRNLNVVGRAAEQSGYGETVPCMRN